MQTPLNIGVDIAKDTVVVACAERSFASRTIANRRAELRAWLRGLPKDSRIGVESTGAYHELLVELAQACGLQVFLLNPKDVRYYARAVGQRGKTDRVDAELIARFVAHEHAKLHPYCAPSAQQRQLQRLLKRRAKLTSIKGALQHSLQALAGFSRESRALARQLNAVLERIDAQIEHLSTRQPEHQGLRTRLQTIVGVGPLNSAALATTLQRIPFHNVDAVVAHTGLDPRPNDSGHKIGRRRLSKRGPSELRRLLFNAAMSASKTKLWRPIYERYRAKGLATTAVLVIIARKIVRIAWALYRNHTTFDPKILTHQP